MAVTDRTLRDLRRMRVELDETVDATTRDLAKAWSRAWQEIVGEWATAIDELIADGDGEWPTRAQISRATRAQRALSVTADALDDLATQAGVRILRDVSMLADDAAGWVERLTATQLPPGTQVDWTRVDDKALDAIVRRTTKQVTSLTRPLSREATAAMKSTLIRGVAMGDNPRAVAREMLSRVERGFDGGRNRAENIARTEMLDAHRAAALASREANTDVIAGWRWLSTMSARTCCSCLARHGTLHPADEPGPHDHPRGRCTAVPVTRPWKDLGFDVDEPADRFPDARQWFDEQPDAVQRQIMGPGRLDALKSGRLGWDDLAELRHNPGWRDSWVVAPLAA